MWFWFLMPGESCVIPHFVLIKRHFRCLLHPAAKDTKCDFHSIYKTQSRRRVRVSHVLPAGRPHVQREMPASHIATRPRCNTHTQKKRKMQTGERRTTSDAWREALRRDAHIPLGPHLSLCFFTCSRLRPVVSLALKWAKTSSTVFVCAFSMVSLQVSFLQLLRRGEGGGGGGAGGVEGGGGGRGRRKVEEGQMRWK